MERKLIVVVVLAAATWQVSIGQINLLENPSFEEDLSKNWRGNGFVPERYTGDKTDGKYSVKCANRRSSISGLYQKLKGFGKGRHYAFEADVKLLNNKEGKLWQAIKVTMLFDFVNFPEVKQPYIIAYRGFATKEKGWIRVNGSIEAPMKEIDEGRLSIRGPDQEVNFLVDNVKLYEVPEIPDWRRQADINIEKYRKSNIAFSVALPPGVNKKDVDLEISLKKHHFVFGAKVTESEMGQKPMTEYEKLFNKWFNWGAVQSYKWKFGTNNKDRYYKDYSRATNVTDILIRNGKTVRAHSVLWDIGDNIPAWVHTLKDSEVEPVVREHIHDVMNLAKGKLAQFDIQNEHVHGHYYEERLQDPNFTKKAFRQAKEEDPNGPVLYLNDFTCITSGANTEDLYDLGMEYQKEGVPLEGIGCQGHVKEFVKPDPTAMWKRLDRLAMTGLELMMTEFDIGWPNKTERADWLEDAIRAFFAHPALRGVILWGIWDKAMRDPDHELVAGPDSNTLTIMPSGKRWACLVNNEWMTRESKNIGVTGTKFVIRGFQGDYDVIVKKKGVPVQTESFSLGKQDARVIIAVTRSDAAIPVEPLKELEENCPNRPTEEKGTNITCRTVSSKKSGSDENDAVSVGCNDDEIMTGCFSYHTSRSWIRLGEKMEFKNGKMQCIAYHGDATGEDMDPIVKKKCRRAGATNPKCQGNSKLRRPGVRAYARCCKMSGMVCDYKKAGPSRAREGSSVEAKCPANELALGCSSFHPFPDVQGVTPVKINGHVQSCKAVAGKPAYRERNRRSGVYAYSACCSDVSHLTCSIVMSKRSKLRKRSSVFAYCAPGDVMTGCSVYAKSGKPAGAKLFLKKFKTGPSREVCRAYLGADLPIGSKGVQAMATCCHVNNIA